MSKFDSAKTKYIINLICNDDFLYSAWLNCKSAKLVFNSYIDEFAEDNSNIDFNEINKVLSS